MPEEKLLFDYSIIIIPVTIGCKGDLPRVRQIDSKTGKM